jgi:hypothetical protein
VAQPATALPPGHRSVLDVIRAVQAAPGTIKVGP